MSKIMSTWYLLLVVTVLLWLLLRLGRQTFRLFYFRIHGPRFIFYITHFSVSTIKQVSHNAVLKMYVW